MNTFTITDVVSVEDNMSSTLIAKEEGDDDDDDENEWPLIQQNESHHINHAEEPTIHKGLSSPTEEGQNTYSNNHAAIETTDTNVSGSLSKKKYVTAKDFELLKVIGIGSFGKVLQVRNKHSNQVLAMKVISKRLLRKKTSYIDNIHAERDILTKIRHPFIVTMHCSFQSREKLFIIMDFLAGGELFLRLGREGIFRESTARFYISEIILALEHLHARGILHRDLKPENILLGCDGHLCLTDFGLAKDFSRRDVREVSAGLTTDDSKPSMNGSPMMDEQHVKMDRFHDHPLPSDSQDEEGKALTICGTQEYMAPEMIAKKGYGKAADFWSLGCIFFEMLQGDPPFQSKLGAKDLFRKIMTERVRMPNHASASACKVIKGLLNRNAVARLGAAKSTMFQTGGIAGLKQEEFFSSIDWSKLERKEIEPPDRFNVDSEGDLRHFYDEFTQMNLPRSVKEMSVDHNPPRRCKSGMFKGFSFIQDDFPLPDRTDPERDYYWSQIEEECASASECASSIINEGEMDLGPRSKVIATEHVSESKDPVDTEKKKSARKKKKPKSTLSTPVPSETQSDAGVSTLDQTEFNANPPMESALHPKAGLEKDDKLVSSSPVLASPSPDPTNRILNDKIGSTPSLSVSESQWETVSNRAPKKAHQLDKTKQIQSHGNSSEWTTVKSTAISNSPHRPNVRHTDLVGPSSNSNAISASMSGVARSVDSRIPKIVKHTGKPDSSERSNDWRDHKMRTPTEGKLAKLQANELPPSSEVTFWPALNSQHPTPSLGSPPQSVTSTSGAPKGVWGAKAGGSPWSGKQ